MKKFLFEHSLRSIAIVLVVYFAFGLSATARTVSLEKAVAKAQRFMSSNSSRAASQARGLSAPTFKLAYEAKTTSLAVPCFYVLNQTSAQGYIIVSADDRLPEVLGYSDSGEFDINKIPDNMKWWLSEYERQIEQVLASSNNSVMPIAETSFRDGWTEIEPLVKTKWNQGTPYNNLCPTINGEKAPTGCVATAMAQIMKYYQWPITGRGSHSYTWNEQPLSMDFSKVTFDWANMKDVYQSIWDYGTNSYIPDWTLEEGNAVATLMQACGISVDMDYDLDGSGAPSYWAAQALNQYFDYDTKYLYREGIEISEWENLVYTELVNKRPVYYSGQSNSSGHAFVCDGYDDNGYFHINWGWGGYLNGHFLLSVLDPYEGMEGREENGYKYDQEIIYSIRPIEKVEIDGVYYSLIEEDGEAFVSIPDEGYYTGDLTIPATVSYGNKTYTVTEVKDNVWSCCQDLTSLIVYAPINEITTWYWDISKSPNLETVKLFNVRHIRASAFRDCANLKTLELGPNLESIGSSAFNGCGALIELTIPDKVTSIGSYAFNGCKSLTRLKLGNSLETIGNTAFYDCNALTELTIPDKVTSIEQLAFYGCTSLKTLKLGENLESIEYAVFYNCSALTELIIPDKVAYISDLAFYNCINLTMLELGTNLETIGAAFRNCNTLLKVFIPNNVKSIGNYAFDGCKALTELTIPDKVTSIGNYAFNGCESLTTLMFGNGLETIGNCAFQNCNVLTELIIPDKVTSIGNNAFYWCPALTSLYLGEDLETIGNLAFYNCDALTELTIPDKVTSIGDYAFYWGQSLTELVIPSKVESIGKNAFYNCMRLKTIVIPNSVITIGEQAFYDTYRYNNRTIISHMEDPLDLPDNVFSDKAYSNDILYVPYGTTGKYQAKEVWKNFKNIKESDPTTVTISVGTDGLSTYCPNYGVDFSEATEIAAYKAAVNGSTVILTQVNTVAAGEGVLLRSVGSGAATETLPIIEATKHDDNAFVGTLVAIEALPEKDGSITYFVLSKKNDAVGFYKANNTRVAAGKAYLPVENYNSAARGLSVTFDDGTTTGVSEIMSEPSTTDDVIYTLSGTRVKSPEKGLYIKNGKKVVVK